MADLSNVIKVTKAQYTTLKSGGTVSGYTYDNNALYLVDEPTEGYTQLKAMTSVAGSTSTTWTVSDMTNYKYIIIRIYYNAVNMNTSVMLPVSYLRGIYNSDSPTGALLNIPYPYSATALRWLRFGFPSNTQIYVNNTQSVNLYCGIYGYND